MLAIGKRGPPMRCAPTLVVGRRGLATLVVVINKSAWNRASILFLSKNGGLSFKRTKFWTAVVPA
jgi:hypothetical protein